MKKARSLVITMLLMFVFALAVPVTSSAARIYVTTTTVNLRRGASTNTARVLELPKEAVVKYLGKSGKNWYKVEYQNNNQQKFRGYIYKKYLQYAKTYITSARLNIRRGTSTNTPVVKTIPKGGKAIIVNTYTGAWYKTVYFAPNGKVYRGYTHQSYLRREGAKKGAYKTTDSVYMHRSPSMSSSSVIVVPKGKTVNVTNLSNGKWYYCSYKASNGRTYKGYVSNVCLKKK